MVHNPDLTREKKNLTAILVANLTPTQLATIQSKPGSGANLCCSVSMMGRGWWGSIRGLRGV